MIGEVSYPAAALSGVVPHSPCSIMLHPTRARFGKGLFGGGNGSDGIGYGAMVLERQTEICGM